ncbi:dihydrolipoyl dehydrogenase family protein, partial [Petrocella sp. FN5]|uniref:dihydrolipoyl dehydrogenase family protein n=1 Tax=Petrocella sp. FN5 TaxID=3032002 RepID=UPI0023D9D200
IKCMKFDYDLIVIGAGSGGLVVASGAASLGAKVALIESEKMGGDCLNSGCVPSKSFLKGAHLAKDIDSSRLFGLDTELKGVSIEKLMGRVQEVITSIEPHDSVERYEGLGVEVILGSGELVDIHHVKVGEKVLNTKNIVISSGSKPYIPPIKGLDQVPYLTNRNIFNLTTQPKHLIVLGGGPIGLELGQGFRHLGSDVTIIDQNPHLFAKDDPEVGPLMEEVLLQDGISLHLTTKIVEVLTNNGQINVIVEKNGLKKEIVGDYLLVSLGRSPVTEGLGLEKVGIKVNQRGYVITNNKLQTNFKNIYACGDVTGPYQFTHMAGYQAGIVIRNSIFHLGAKLDYSAVPWTTYTKPEVAHVGHTEVTARESSVFNKSILIPLGDNDRARAENDEKGFLKLIISNKNKLIGATLVGEKAGEMIPVATLAIRQKLKASAFLGLIFSYPTEAEIFKTAALKELKDSVKPWQSKLIKSLFLRH